MSVLRPLRDDHRRQRTESSHRRATDAQSLILERICNVTAMSLAVEEDSERSITALPG